MRVLLLALLSTTLTWAEPSVPRYEYQRPLPPRQSSRDRGSPSKTYSNLRLSPKTVTRPAVVPFDARQRPAPDRYSNWGGTVTGAGNGPITITSNGSVPANSIVCIGRGNRYIGQGRLLNGHQIEGAGLEARPGDWVSLISVPHSEPPPESSPLPSQPDQMPAQIRYSGWGGTVISSTDGRITITSNGSLPTDSVVCIGRGEHYIGEGRLVNGEEIRAYGVEAQPGDWVSVISVPLPPKPSVFQYPRSTHSNDSHHPTSTNADPRYREWLQRGF